MNLLVGLAVSDINSLRKTGKRDHLFAQVELINYVQNICSSKLFKYLPQKCQIFFKNRILNQSEEFQMKVSARFSDVTDKTFPERLKKILFNHSLSKEQMKNEDLK